MMIQIHSLSEPSWRESSEHGFHKNELNHESSTLVDSIKRNRKNRRLHTIIGILMVMGNEVMGASSAAVSLSRIDNSTNTTNESEMDILTVNNSTNGTNGEFDILIDDPEMMAANNTVNETQLEVPDTSVNNTTTTGPMPSASPSKEPTLHPSAASSSSPSINPTMYPTFTPVPTNQPSVSPTDYPSSSPSDVPSALPTFSCHDVASYRSPINNLTCEDHANTDCMRWRYLGLNLTHLQELAESCPVTCDIDCGYFTVLDSNISFIISNVPRLIDDLMSRAPLELVTQEYLTQYILKMSPITKFALTQVNLLFQEPLNITTSPQINETTRNLAPMLRQAQQNGTVQDSINLRVKLNLQGYKIYPILIVLDELLIEGIDSPEYTAELRGSDDFYLNATASSAVQADPGPRSVPAPPDDNTISPAAISLVLVGFACVGIAGAMWYRKHGRKVKTKQRELPMNMGEAPRSSGGSVHPSVFSFDGSPQNSTGVGRLVAVLSSNGTRSKDSTSPSSSQETSPTPRKAKAVVEDHPLTGVIPPMLVIDNIERPYPNESMQAIPERPRSTKKKIVVPTKRINATDSFIEALNKNGSDKAGSSSKFNDLVYSVSSLGSAPRESGNFPPNRALVAVLSGDASLPDDSSVSSTPVKITDMAVKVPKRRILSSSRVANDVAVQEVLDQFMKSNWHLDESPREDFSSSMHELNVSVSYDKPPPRPPGMEGDHRRSSSWDRTNLIGSPQDSFRKSLDPKKLPHRKSKRNLQQSRSKNSSRDSNSSVELLSADGECLYVYEASHRRYLGLAIEPCPRGTRVQSVKEYSPLYGLIKKGDRIVDVDGIDTTQKTTAGVAELLRRKKGRNRKICITVARTTNESVGGIPTLPTTTKRRRSKSIGSMAVSVPVVAQNTQYRGISPVTDLDSSYTDIPTPYSDPDEELPFHFIGAAEYEEPDYESFSDISSHLAG